MTMPGGDRTGPAGMGPTTGRAAGYCAGYPAPGFVNPVPGGGFWGWGRGGGRGWRNWYYATGLTGGPQAALGVPAFGFAAAPVAPFGWPLGQPTMSPKQELDLLKRQAELLTNTLDGIRRRIDELEAQPQEEKEGT